MQKRLRLEVNPLNNLVQYCNDKSPIPPARVTTLSVERLKVICWWDGTMKRKTSRREMIEMFILTLI